MFACICMGFGEIAFLILALCAVAAALGLVLTTTIVANGDDAKRGIAVDIRTFVKNIGAEFGVHAELDCDGNVIWMNIDIKGASRCTNQGQGDLSLYGRSNNPASWQDAYDEAMEDLTNTLAVPDRDYTCLKFNDQPNVVVAVPWQELEYNYQPDPVCACGKAAPGECRSCG